jgi:hypothetical protein
MLIKKEIEELRRELCELIDLVGNDYRAAELLDEICEGHGPKRNTLTRIRNGEGKPATIAMTTILLRLAVKAKQ